MEHEIRKHMHNILAETTNRKKSVWKRLGEIMIEVIIIVFAVSFAVFMERQREVHHEEKEVKEFLTGLKTDLKNDIKEMEEDKLVYKDQAKWMNYFGKEEKINQDSLRRHEWLLWNNTHLLVNNGRYEGFKSSGKINTIENTELRNNILDLYQEIIIGLTNNTSGYNELKKDLQRKINYARKHAGQQNDNLAEVLQEQEIKNYCIRLQFTGESVRRYDSAISRSQRIIELIDSEYPEK